MRTALVLIALFATLVEVPAAQTRLGLELGGAAFSGGSLDTSVGGLSSLKPYHASVVGVRVEYMSGRLGIGIALLRGSPGVAQDAGERVVVGKDLLSVIEAAPAVSIRLANLDLGTVLRAQAGPLIDVWSPKGASDRTRFGAQTGVTLEWPVSKKLMGTVGISVAWMGSAFEQQDLPPSYARRTMVRRSIAGGVRWRL